MPTSEFNRSDVPEFDKYEEVYAVPETRPIAPEYQVGTDPETPVKNEFTEDVPKSYKDPEKKAREERKKVRRRKNFLLQAAAIATSVVLTTSAMGVDILGDELNTEILDEALKHAGAKKGKITVSMLWATTDDVDLHVITPDGTEIYYGNPQAAGGELDVDMQVSEFVAHPIENIYFEEPERGTYKVFIHNFTDRNPGDPQVLVQVTVLGRTKSYTVILDEWEKEICTFTY